MGGALRWLLVAATLSANVASQDIVIDVASEFGVTFDGVAKAMTKATTALSTGRSVTVFFARGMHSINMCVATVALSERCCLCCLQHSSLLMQKYGILLLSLHLHVLC